jgi:histidinol-phosphatase (PHP family)
MPIDPDWEPYIRDQTLHLPALDIEEYLAELEESRERHPELTILSGVEISEPHWNQREVAELIADGRLDRVISSVHAGTCDEGTCEVSALFSLRPADEVVREYLAEVRSMIENFQVSVLGHIDYAARYWPGNAGTYNINEFENEHRAALAALAARHAALEINTQRPLETQILRWWIEEGGQHVTFGSDSHTPDTVAAGLLTAAQIAADLGFAPQASPHEPWLRRRR